jgi:biopolymer transport protein ExbD
MKRIVCVLIVPLAIAILAAGCATTGPAQKNEVQLSVAHDGSLTIEKEQTSLANLGQTFEKLGVRNDAMVLIRTEKDVETKHITAVLSKLNELGYKNVGIAAAQ